MEKELFNRIIALVRDYIEKVLGLEHYVLDFEYTATGVYLFSLRFGPVDVAHRMPVAVLTQRGVLKFVTSVVKEINLQTEKNKK